MADKQDLSDSIARRNALCAVLLLVLIVICSLIVKVLTIVPTSSEIAKGNISNLGLVCEDSNGVYYNKYNEGIFKVKGKKEEQITDEIAYGMQVVDDWIYYLTTVSNGNSYIKMIKTNGKDVTLVKQISTSLNKFYIEDGFLYYTSNLSNSGIIKLDLESREEINIAKGNIKDFQLVDDLVYYTDDLGSIYSVTNKGTDSKIVLSNVDITEFQIYKGVLYYYNQGENNLMTYELGSQNAPKMLTDKVTSYNYNVYNNKIYFYDSESKKIRSCDLSGKGIRDLIDINSNSTRINLTKNGTLYYLDTRKGSTQFQMYRIMSNGMNTTQIDY